MPSSQCETRASRKIAVGEHLEAQVAAANGAQQVMPLQDLMQNNAVEEPAQRKAKPGRGERERPQRRWRGG